jgi:hypothetical protein
MKIIHKDSWGFWFFKRYSLIVEDENESLTEVIVSKTVWEKFKIGDFYIF